MECLSGLVGLRGCGNSTPGSGLYINSLPGIPMELLDKISSAEQGTAQGLWTDTEILAQEQLLMDFTILMGDRFQINDIAKMFQLPTDASTTNSPQGAFDNGFTLDLGTTHPISRLMKVGVDKVGIYLTAVPGAPFDIKIANYDTGQVLKTITVPTANLVVGWNYFDVLESYWCKHLKFYYTASEALTKLIPFPVNLNQRFCNCYCSDQCPGQIRGISDGTFSTVNSYGLTASISFECSFEGIICANRKKFSRPLWYLLGHTVMAQTLASHRYSRFNTTDREKIKELKDDFFADYSKAMKLLSKGITLNDDDFCLSCDPTIMKGFVHP